MTMARSRKAKSASQPSARGVAEAALPSLAGYWSDAEIQEWSKRLLADLDSAAAMAKTPHGKNDLRITSVAATAQADAEKTKVWLGMLFERIELLERQLKATKGMQRKALDNRFSLDDLEVEQIDDRNVRIALVRGDDEAGFTLRFPVVIDRGPWSERGIYERGDGVSWSGSWWIAKEDNPSCKPGEGAGWRMAVKRGRDGKDAK